MTCDKAAQLHAYHDGELDAADARMLEAHLDRCAECSRLLEELRRLSAAIGRSPLPQMPDRAISRFYGSWNAARDRGALRAAGWLTAVAASLLVGAILMWPGGQRGAVASSNMWETVAVSPPAETGSEGNSELVQVAQWMADDLSLGDPRGRR
jgi:anti-sigma factor RsiW